MKKIGLLFVLSAYLGTGVAQTSVKPAAAPKSWHLLNKEQDGYYGIGVEKAYNELLKDRKSVPVIVAVIDSGVDTLHEDLKPVLWRNPGEIPGNGIDDDKNGFVDDIYGWNFLGGKNGENVNKDSYEAARVYYKLKKKFANGVPDDSTASPELKQEIALFKKVKDLVEGDAKEAAMNVMFLKNMVENMPWADSVVQAALKKEEYKGDDVIQMKPASADESKAKSTIQVLFMSFKADEMTNKKLLGMIREFYDGEKAKVDAVQAEPEDYRGKVVKDNYDDFNDRYYGNNDVMAGTPMHGTHVSGIIGAIRHNNLGGDGIADNVKIMTLRAVPDGDEHDKDIANAIFYAVDNGARVINMSFGKSISPEKHWVDSAVQYAASKGVLLVHAAGNDAKDLDQNDNFPNPYYNEDTATRADNWITVGASGDPANGGITASFSNYGKNGVDVFAPGVQIYSTMPGGDAYGNLNGTSMASPVVAGVAALLMSYFPELTAVQIKEAIENSVTKLAEQVNIPGTQDKVSLSDISRKGGVVDAYGAVNYAIKLAEKNKEPQPLPKSKMKSSKKG